MTTNKLPLVLVGVMLALSGCASQPATVPVAAAEPAVTAAPITVPTALRITGTLRILVVGDSISCGGFGSLGWCVELDRLLSAAHVNHELLARGVGATRCEYWAEHIGDVLIDTRPNLVIFGCGTNDGARGAKTGQPQAGTVQAAVLSVADQVHAHGARLLTGTPYYSGPLSGIPDLPAWEREAYPGIPAAFQTFGAYSYGVFAPAMFDDSAMPATSEYVLIDNVHPTEAGYVVLARNRYQAMRSFYVGLPALDGL